MVPSGLADIVRGLRSRRVEEELAARQNPFLVEALRKEKLEGQRIAAWARTVALVASGILITFQNASWSVLYFHGLLLIFIALGWAQLRYATVGHSRVELALILADLVLLAVTLTVPNPFAPGDFPTAMIYRFETFPYFFIILALATLAYSWRTVLTMGSAFVAIWFLSVLGVALFGTTDPELGSRVAVAFAAMPGVRDIVDPNSVVWSIRAQEMVIFFLVSAILALRGQRSNALLIRQASNRRGTRQPVALLSALAGGRAGVRQQRRRRGSVAGSCGAVCRHRGFHPARRAREARDGDTAPQELSCRHRAGNLRERRHPRQVSG